MKRPLRHTLYAVCATPQHVMPYTQHPLPVITPLGVMCAQSVYGYLSLLGSSALLAAPAAESEPAAPAAPPAEPAVPAAVPAAVPVVPVVPAAAPAPPPAESLTAVYARLEELQVKLAALQTDFQVSVDRMLQPIRSEGQDRGRRSWLGGTEGRD